MERAEQETRCWGILRRVIVKKEDPRLYGTYFCSECGGRFCGLTNSIWHIRAKTPEFIFTEK